MKLYEIPQMVRQALEAVTVNEETGEIEGTAALELTGAEAQEKILNTFCYVKELEADAKTLAEQIKNLQARKKSLERTAMFFKSQCSDAMHALGVSKLKNSQITGGFRKTTSVQIEDLDSLPVDFIRIEKSADKLALKAQLSEGVVIPGASLVTNESLSIR
ncbi:siphovirus Gp157 family protein [uncultured Parasutterella sp.]|uniref:siphovirus Gp157 family protein n=1 Tax=uncultured Parasutterella sp. TaxID=1263098 RepID=UPI0025B78F0C|nr:siphovirus Gp157 family protein [uncultured Parasutterella sp.]